MGFICILMGFHGIWLGFHGIFLGFHGVTNLELFFLVVFLHGIYGCSSPQIWWVLIHNHMRASQQSGKKTKVFLYR